MFDIQFLYPPHSFYHSRLPLRKTPDVRRYYYLVTVLEQGLRPSEKIQLDPCGIGSAKASLQSGHITCQNVSDCPERPTHIHQRKCWYFPRRAVGGEPCVVNLHNFDYAIERRIVANRVQAQLCLKMNSLATMG